MQATVRTYDPESGSGTVLLDDGTELAYDRPVFEAAGLRHLRLGQRVQVELAGEGSRTKIAALSLYTLH